MRSGALRNIVKILDFQTISDGQGGTIQQYFADEVQLLEQFSGRVIDSGGTIITTDCGSDFLVEFIEDKKVWAEIRQKQGIRGLNESKIDLQNYTEFVFRYDDIPDINKKWLLEFDSRRFTIHSYYVINERKRTIIVNAVEIK